MSRMEISKHCTQQTSACVFLVRSVFLIVSVLLYHKHSPKVLSVGCRIYAKVVFNSDLKCLSKIFECFGCNRVQSEYY